MSDTKNLKEETPEVEQPKPASSAAESETMPEIFDPEPEIGPSNSAELVSLLQENLDLTRKLEEAQRSELYAQAEYQNYRRRSEERFIDQQKYNNAEFIKALLPVLDNFERALASAEQSQNFEALISGVKGTLKQLQAAIQKAGVTPIEAVGKEFDPKYHEAIGNTESDEYPSNTVAEEVQRGYILHDRVLRPTLVRVTD
jgi:molecular chaperone GrpE